MELRSDFVLFHQKGSPQRYGALEGEYVNDWLHFDAGEEDLALWEELGIPLDQAIPLASVEPLSDLIRLICEEMRSSEDFGKETAALYGRILWYKLAELCRRGEPREMWGHYETLRRLRHEIYHAPEADWRVEKLAERAALSRSYFQHLYTRFFGVSVTADVIKSRVAHAGYLLQSTNEAVGDVARRCGYQSEVHFMRQFKKRTGMSPSEYRRRGRVGTEGT
jgi:AraC family transcriptional regulator of arabinose operon